MTENDHSNLSRSLRATVKSNISYDEKAVNSVNDKAAQAAFGYYICRMASPTLVEAWTKENPKNKQFLDKFLADTEWMGYYLNGGITPKDTVVALDVLARIDAKYGKEADFATYKKLATGIALTWATGRNADLLQRMEKETAPINKMCPLWRYEFYKNAHKKNRLQKDFLKLEPWEIRFLIGNTWEDAALKFASENFNLPPESYADACWAAPYTIYSEFGDSIHGTDFYLPWGDEANNVERTVTHGGVCGALSHVGMTAAAANGIPSFTLGQPGHCAYAFRPSKGNWVGAYMGPEGSPHNWIFEGTTPMMSDLMEDAFANPLKTVQSFQHVALATILFEEKLYTQALSEWKKALRETPCNYNTHMEFQDFLDELSPMEGFPVQVITDYISDTIMHMRDHGFAMYKVLDPMFTQFADKIAEDQLVHFYVCMHKALAKDKSTWSQNINEVLYSQYRTLSDETLQQQFVKTVLTTHMQEPENAQLAKTFEWAAGLCWADEDENQSFAELFHKIIEENCPDEKKRDKIARNIFGNAIIAAEKSKDRDLIQRLNEMAEPYKPAFTPRYNDRSLFSPKKGKLISPTANILLSSYDSDTSSALLHASALTRDGGKIKTKGSSSEYCILSFPQDHKITSMVLTLGKDPMTNGYYAIYRSLDGSTWTQERQLSVKGGQWSVTFDTPIHASHIKIESLINQPIDLEHILIYAQ